MGFDTVRFCFPIINFTYHDDLMKGAIAQANIHAMSFLAYSLARPLLVGKKFPGQYLELAPQMRILSLGVSYSHSSSAA